MTSLAYSSDGGRIVSASHDDTLLVWDVVQSTIVAEINGIETV